MLCKCKQIPVCFFLILAIASTVHCFNDDSYAGDISQGERTSRYDKTELVGFLNKLFSAASPSSRYLFDDDIYGGAKRSAGGLPPPGFVGVRGKKGSGVAPGFVGARGKKSHPWLSVVPQSDITYRR